MNVADKCHQVHIGIDQHRVVAALEQVASGIKAHLHRAGVLTGNS